MADAACRELRVSYEDAADASSATRGAVAQTCLDGVMWAVIVVCVEELVKVDVEPLTEDVEEAIDDDGCGQKLCRQRME
jgi:hypothetical protein